MKRRPHRGDVVGHREGGIVVVLLFLTAATLSASGAPSARRTGLDAHGGGAADSSWMLDAVGRAWNETDFWVLDAPDPTEYFPEDEGFILVSVQRAQAAPGPQQKAKDPGLGGGASSKGKEVTPGVAKRGREEGGVVLSRHGRHLLDVAHSRGEFLPVTGEGIPEGSPLDVDGQDLWSLGAEGSGEGSGYGSL